MMRESIQRELEDSSPKLRGSSKKQRGKGSAKTYDRLLDNASNAQNSITSEDRPKTITKYEIPERPDRAEYRAYVEEQTKKLEEFLKFKSQSKALSKETARLANAVNGYNEESQAALSSDSSDDGTARHIDYKTLKDNPNKVTFDFKGRMLSVKQLVLPVPKYITPEIIIGGRQGTSISTRAPSELSMFNREIPE